MAGCVQCVSLSRRSPRYRIDIAATAVPLLGGDMAVCRTLDVSDVGVSLDTAAWFPLGTRLSLSLIDPASGSAIEVIGDVVREAVARDAQVIGISAMMMHTADGPDGCRAVRANSIALEKVAMA